MIRRCNSLKQNDVMENVPCTAYMDREGKVHDGCGEPCSWIIQKSGYGDPPWRTNAEEAAAANEREIIAAWLMHESVILAKLCRADASSLARELARSVKHGHYS